MTDLETTKNAILKLMRDAENIEHVLKLARAYATLCSCDGTFKEQALSFEREMAVGGVNDPFKGLSD